MSDLRRHLEQAGNRRTGIGAAALLERVDRQLAGEPTTGLVIPPSPRYPAWMIVSVSAAAVFVLIGAFALLVRGDRSPVGGSVASVPDTTTTTGPPPSPVTTAPGAFPAPPAHAAALADGWSEVLHSSHPEIWDVIGLPGGGFAAAGLGAQLAVSPDGITWEDLSATIESDSGFLHAAAASSGAAIVVGGTCEEGDCPAEQAIWATTDGAVWQRVAGEGIFDTCEGETWWECFTSIDEVAGYPGGFLATGWRAGKPSANAAPRSWAILTSEDGMAWTRLTAPDLGDLGYLEQQRMLEDPDVQTDLILRPLGRIGGRHVLWVQFSVLSDGESAGLPVCCEWDVLSVMAVSEDGATWDPVPLFDDPDGSLVAVDSSTSANQMVAVGSNDGVSAAWTTGDGITWTPGEMAGDGSGGRLVSVTGTPAGLVALGETGVVEYGTGDAEASWPEEGPVLWQSDDGARWFRVDTTGLEATMFRALAESGGTLIAVGSHWPLDGGEGFAGAWAHPDLIAP